MASGTLKVKFFPWAVAQAADEVRAGLKTEDEAAIALVENRQFITSAEDMEALDA